MTGEKPGRQTVEVLRLESDGAYLEGQLHSPLIQAFLAIYAGETRVAR
jgi:hypothetical protein